MNIWKIILLVAFLGVLSEMPAVAKNAESEKQLIASFSGFLKRCIFQNDKIVSAENIIDTNRWSYVYWPSYDRARGLIYFEALDDIDQGASTNVYSINLLGPKQQPTKVIDNARLPSLSPDNNYLAFYRHPNQLWIKSLKSKKVKMVLADFDNYRPCVWGSDNQLLYNNLNDELVLYNLLSNEKRKSGYVNVVPGALSPDRGKILCGSSDGKKIYLYILSSKELRLIKKNEYRSIGTDYIWLPDESGFVFAKQTWQNLLMINESRDLFLYKFSGKETRLWKKIALFGGAFIDVEIEMGSHQTKE